jgi:hypothetical protein
MKIKRALLLSLLLLAVAGLANTTAQAAGICVHPAGAGPCFASIQAAVDAADDGDVISIRSGKYVEQVTIFDKDLTLVGQSNTILQAPPDMQDTLSAVGGVEGRPLILVAEAEVSLRNLTLDGLDSAEANPFLDGIVFVNAGGVIRNNTVKNMGFGEPALPIIDGYPSYQGNGIVVANLSATPRTVRIEDNRVFDFNSVGITVFANADPANPALATLTAHILDNEVTAQGANEVIDQWGIFLGGYDFAEPQFSVTGTIQDNQVRNMLTLSPYPLPGVGIATLYTYTVDIADNKVESANVSLAANLAFAARITNNRMTGPQKAAPGSTGLILSGSNILVRENHFKKLDLGLLLMVDDPMFGSALNTSLDENHFDKVALDLLTGAGPLTASAASDPQSRPRFGPR